MRKSNESVTVSRIQHGGSALVEVIVLCIVLLPLLFLVPMIGNIADAKHVTVQASRYLAWEQTVSVDAGSSRKVRARFYDNPDGKLTSSDAEPPGQADSGGLWRIVREGQGGGSLPASTIGLRFPPGAGFFVKSDIGNTRTAVEIGKRIKSMGSTLDFLDSVNWNIEGDGTVDAGIELNLLSNSLLGSGSQSCKGTSVNGVFGCVSAHNLIMTDGWGVAENSVAEDRSRAFVPAATLKKTGKALSVLGKIPMFNEIGDLEHAFGHVDSTQLPVDRYVGPYRSAQ